jgi:hypothetical protein
VRQIGGGVDVARAAVQRIQILREGLPVPGQPLGHDGARNILDAFHDVDQQIVILPPAGREADAAIAHHHGRDAMRRRRGHA